MTDYLVPASGTEESNAASLYGLIQAAVSARLSACLAGRGFRQQPMTQAEEAAEAFDNSDFPDLGKMARTGVFGSGSMTAAQLAPVGLTKSQQAAYLADRRACESRSDANPFRGFLSASQALVSEWSSQVSAAESDQQVIAHIPPYQACMEATGVPARWVRGPNTANALGFFLAWETGAQTQASASALATVEHHWVSIFLRCATPMVTALDADLATRRSAFLQGHYQEISTLGSLAGRDAAEAGVG